MKFLDRLERKLAKYSIPHLMYYVIFGKIIGAILALFVPQIAAFMYLDPELVLKGQVWRLITFIFMGSLAEPITFLLELYFYFISGQLLERYWGTFKLNLYYFSGVIFAIAAAFVCYIFDPYVIGTDGYIYETLFFAIATLFADLQFYLFFFIPIKAKWIGIIGAALLLFNFIFQDWVGKLYMLICMLSYILFFAPMLISRIKNGSRKQQYENKLRQGASVYESPSKGKIVNDIPFHRCCICGITEKDDPNMIFRYCSQCSGSYEYCSNHINNHEHHV